MSDTDPLFLSFFLKFLVLVMIGFVLTAVIYMTYNWSLADVFKVRVRIDKSQ
jgi:hypothetical protein